MDEAEAVAAARAGDRDAFGQLYDLTFDAVFRCVMTQTGDHRLAEDVTADTFERALSRIEQLEYRGPGSTRAWVLTIACNLLRDHWKNPRRRQLPAGLPPQWRNHPTVPAADVAVVLAEESRQLLAAVLRLPLEQRECVALRFVLELPTAAVAQIMGRTTTAVTSLQYRAIRALQRQLDRTRPPGRRELSTGPAGRLDLHRVRPAR